MLNTASGKHVALKSEITKPRFGRLLLTIDPDQSGHATSPFHHEKFGYKMMGYKMNSRLCGLESWVQRNQIYAVHVCVKIYDPAAYQQPMTVTHATLAPDAVLML